MADEFQLKNGIAPWLRTLFSGVSGKLMKLHWDPEHSANGEEKEEMETGRLARCSNSKSACMSQGAASPVSWLPTCAPQ